MYSIPLRKHRHVLFTAIEKYSSFALICCGQCGNCRHIAMPILLHKRLRCKDAKQNTHANLQKEKRFTEIYTGKDIQHNVSA